MANSGLLESNVLFVLYAVDWCVTC